MLQSLRTANDAEFHRRICGLLPNVHFVLGALPLVAFNLFPPCVPSPPPNCYFVSSFVLLSVPGGPGHVKQVLCK